MATAALSGPWRFSSPGATPTAVFSATTLDRTRLNGRPEGSEAPDIASSARGVTDGMIAIDDRQKSRGCILPLAYRIRGCTYCHAAPVGKPSRKCCLITLLPDRWNF